MVKKQPQAKETIKNSEEKFRVLFESARDGIFLIDSKGKVVALNKSFADMHGYTVEELLKMKLKDLDTKETSKLAPGRMKKILSGETLIFEVEHLRKNGQVIPLEVSANLVTIGKEKYVLGFHRDITERKLAEKNFQKIFDESPVGIIITGANSQFLKVNKRFCELVGYTEEELLEMGFRDITHPDTVASDLGAVKRMINGEIKTYHTEKRYIKKTGEPTWVLVTASAVFEGKSFLYFITTVEDINSKKLAEEQLLNKTQEINSFFDVVPDLLCISDSSEKFIRINKSWEKVLGYPVKELLGKKVLDFVHPEDREKTQKLLNIATQEPVIDFTNRYLAKDGSYRILEWRSRPVGGTVYSAARDITDREKMQ